MVTYSVRVKGETQPQCAPFGMRIKTQGNFPGRTIRSQNLNQKMNQNPNQKMNRNLNQILKRYLKQTLNRNQQAVSTVLVQPCGVGTALWFRFRFRVWFRFRFRIWPTVVTLVGSEL